MHPETSGRWTQGLIAGGIGYVTVAVLMLVADLAQGRPAMFTPALLGNFFFYGLEDPSASRIWAGPVLAYNGVHLLAFLALGALMSWLASVSERGPQLWYVGLTGLLVVIFHVFAFAFGATQRLGNVFSPWMALVAGVLAAAAMTVYLLWAHPALRRELRRYREAT